MKELKDSGFQVNKKDPANLFHYFFGLGQEYAVAWKNQDLVKMQVILNKVLTPTEMYILSRRDSAETNPKHPLPSASFLHDFNVGVMWGIVKETKGDPAFFKIWPKKNGSNENKKED